MQPGTTSEALVTAAPGQELLRSFTLEPGTRAIAIAAEPSLNVPTQLVLIDPHGRVVQTVKASSGVAILEAPITTSGVYILKVVNLSTGPVSFWLIATPLME